VKTIPTLLQQHLDGEGTKLSLCWIITKRNGLQILGTDHDQNITIASGAFAGTYQCRSNILPSNVKSNADLAVDNMDVLGAVGKDGTLYLDISVDDFEVRNLDFARVKTFFVNWADPDMGQVPMRTGFLGQMTYDSDGLYKTEVRGISQLLQQNIVQTYSDRCTVQRLGDTRCNVDTAALTVSVVATSVTSRREFEVTGAEWQIAGYYTLGNLVCVTGLNAGLLRQIRLDNDGGSGSAPGALTLFEAFPEDVAPGDTFTMSPGCDRLISTCLNKFDNLANFRGFGILIPGIDALLSGGSGNRVVVESAAIPVPPVSPVPVPPTPTGKTYDPGLYTAIAPSQHQVGHDSGSFSFSNGTITITGSYADGALPGGHTGTTGSGVSPKDLGFTGNHGVLMRYDWSEVEPTKDNYDFTRMDADYAQCLARGIQWCPMIVVKKFDGSNPAPAYLSAYVASSGSTVMLWRWNSAVVQARWAAMMAAFGTRYNGCPNLEGLVTQETANDVNLTGTGYSEEIYFNALCAEHDAIQLYIPDHPHIAFQNFMHASTIAIGDKWLDRYAAYIQKDGAVLAGPDLVRSGAVNSRCYGRAVAYHAGGTTASGVTFTSTGPTGQSWQHSEWSGAVGPGPTPIPETIDDSFKIGTGVISGTPFTQHCDYLFYDYSQATNPNGENYNNAFVPLAAAHPGTIGTWVPP